MIEWDEGNCRIYCDVCFEFAEVTFPEFMDAVKYKKQHGWKSQRRGGEWEDVCPECQEAGE